jgi:hypothetical protein
MTLLDRLHRWWFFGSCLLIATLFYLLHRRGQTMQKLIADTISEKLRHQLATIREQAQKSGSDYVEAKKKYEALKARHPELFSKYSRRPNGAR